MDRRTLLKSACTVGSISLLSGCNSRLNEYVFEETDSFSIEPGLSSFSLRLNENEPIKLVPNTYGGRIFALVSPRGNVVLTNMHNYYEGGYTIKNLESGEYQLIVGEPSEYSSARGGISVLRSSYPRLTDAKSRRSVEPDTLARMAWEQSHNLWEIDQLHNNNWENAEEMKNNRGKLTQYLTPSENLSSIQLTEAMVIEKIIESVDYELDSNHSKILEYLLLTQKVYTILEQMRTSLEGILDSIVNILVKAIAIKFGGSYSIDEDSLKNSIRDAVSNQFTLHIGPITSESKEEVSYIMFLTGTSSFNPLPEVEMTAKLEVDANLDSYFPYEVSPNFVETYQDIKLIETGN